MDEKKKVEPISGVLGALFSRRDWGAKLGLHQVFRFWNEVVGPEIADHAQPTVIHGRVLWLEVSDSVWMQQLHLQKTELLAALNARLKGEQLADLRFRLGRERQEPVPPAAPSVRRDIDPERRRHFANLFGAITDPEIRASLSSFWEKTEKATSRSTDSEEPG